MLHFYHRKGVSPYVASITMAIIVLSLGSFLYMNAIKLLDQRYNELRDEVLRTEFELKQVLDIVSSYIDSSNTLKVFLSIGSYPVKVLGIYINDTLYSDQCTIYFNGTEERLSSQPYVPPFSLAIITCPGIDGSFVRVKIVYRGGEDEAYAQKLSS